MAAVTHTRVVCVGDLHGNLPQALALWKNLETRYGTDALHNDITVVFLGDYCDRGPDTKGVLEWLTMLKATRPAGRTRFIAGNHDFGMAAFLGLIPGKPAELDNTRPPEYTSGFWPHAVDEGMHYQGRRWGGHHVYEARWTFESYGLTREDFMKAAVDGRDRFIAAVPEHHKEFLRELEWVAELDMADGSRVVCVHAGLEGSLDPKLRRDDLADYLVRNHVDGVDSEEAAGKWIDAQVERQLAALRAKDWRDRALAEPPSKCQSRIAAFVGRVGVEAIPRAPSLANTTLVSGHHGFRSLDRTARRAIVDRGGGRPGQPIEALELPSWSLTSSDELEVAGVRV